MRIRYRFLMKIVLLLFIIQTLAPVGYAATDWEKVCGKIYMRANRHVFKQYREVGAKRRGSTKICLTSTRKLAEMMYAAGTPFNLVSGHNYKGDGHIWIMYRGKVLDPVASDSKHKQYKDTCFDMAVNQGNINGDTAFKYWLKNCAYTQRGF